MADAQGGRTPPEGFLANSGRGPFSSANGPIYHRLEGEFVQHCFFAEERHTNGMGLVHGGMLTAFLDGLLAGAVFRGAQRPAVTIHLSVDFLHMVRAGEWVMGEAKLTRATADVAFAEGRAFVGERDLVRATGVFKLMKGRR
ncbi:MAG TPA: PaaI family thioesterase [Phenylobacterium sp.]